MQLAPAANRPGGCARWLEEHGPRELEQLFRAVICHPSVPVVIADDERRLHDLSVGASKLLGVPREKIIGSTLDDFAPPVWQELLKKGEREGTLELKGSDGTPRPVEFTASANILPARHVIALADLAAPPPSVHDAAPIPPWVQDYALFLLDADGKVAAWYAGAERIYGYTAKEAAGQSVALLYPGEDTVAAKVRLELERAASANHFGNEGWQMRKDGSRFWANIITMALRGEEREIRGFARVVRDFTARHDRDEELRRSRAHTRAVLPEASVSGVVSGEFDRVTEVNDTFLALSGYSREELCAMPWTDLTPAEYLALDEIAHEEGLLFGSCTPYEKELIRKDGRRVPVLVVNAVLKLSPFRWITFVQDLSQQLHERTAQHITDESDADFGEMVGSSTALRRVQRLIEVVAPTDATVLILGETGTGKELVARAVHRLSLRRDHPFVILNCAAIPTGLLESELFGYERGAFTGALSQKIGRFELAHRGTLFLDEVGDIPLELQPKLLRALQEKAFERLGGTKTIPIDVRLIAATNRDLAQMMDEKLFRSDLYYRLKVFPITTLPLRDHPEDIPVLVRHFVKVYSGKMGRTIDTIPAETMRTLSAWHWPGNVRELENFMERSVILSSGTSLRAPLAEIKQAVPKTAVNDTLDQMEREHILRVLRESEGVVTTAATRLGLHRTTLNAMMRKLGISRKDF
jgi:PAS domain S-box-containing protein